MGYHFFIVFPAQQLQADCLRAVALRAIRGKLRLLTCHPPWSISPAAVYSQPTWASCLCHGCRKSAGGTCWPCLVAITTSDALRSPFATSPTCKNTSPVVTPEGNTKDFDFMAKTQRGKKAGPTRVKTRHRNFSKPNQEKVLSRIGKKSDPDQKHFPTQNFLFLCAEIFFF